MFIKVYAVLVFVSAFWAVWRAGYIVIAGQASQYSVRLVFELLWAAFNVALGVGILRLRPVWRVIALVCCCWVFFIFAVILLVWWMWPPKFTWPVMLEMLVVVAINGFFFYRFRQPDIKRLFHARSAVTPSV